MVVENDQFLNVIIFCILILVVGMFIIENPELFGARKKVVIEEGGDAGIDFSSPLSNVFYKYNHQSEKEWCKWMENQPPSDRMVAVDMLIAHLNDKPQNWGFITIEALECLKSFMDVEGKNIDGNICNFFKKCGKIWNDFKSIPNYYRKAGEVLIQINAQASIKIFEEEIERKNNNQVSLEKKRIITDILPGLNEQGVDIMVNLLISNSETFGTRSHALRVTEKFITKVRDDIQMHCLNRIVSRYKGAQTKMRTEEAHFIQDLLEECTKKVHLPRFFEVLRSASECSRLKNYVLNPLIKSLNSGLKNFEAIELYAITKLEDNEHFDLRRALARRNQLEPAEINNIVTQAHSATTRVEDLLNKESNDLRLPIPSIFSEKYEDFKSLFFKNSSDHEYVTSEKIFGGLLMTGDERVSKIYFSRALAKEKDWNFGYLDAAAMTSKTSYQKAIDLFGSLRKPYMLYLVHPEALFTKQGNESDTLKGKYVQSLSIQSLDTKSFLAGDIQVPLTKTRNTSLTDYIRSLRSKFFPQSVDINKFPEEVKVKILNEYIKHISSHRFQNRSAVKNELLASGKTMHVLDFCFFVVEKLSQMLLVYGKDVPLGDLEELEEKLKDMSSGIDDDSEGSESKEDGEDEESGIDDFFVTVEDDDDYEGMKLIE